MEVEPGGHWRYVEHAPDGLHGFEGRYRGNAPDPASSTPSTGTASPATSRSRRSCFEDLGDGAVDDDVAVPHHRDRDGMLGSDMEQGLAQGYAALDALLEQLS